jgi:hypothetical protein
MEGFQVLTPTSMYMAVFWDVAPCSLVDTDRRFRGAFYLHHQGEKRSTGQEISSLLNPKIHYPAHNAGLSTRTPEILSFSWFASILKQKYLKLGHDRFLPHHSLVILSLDPYKPAVLASDSVRKYRKPQIN